MKCEDCLYFSAYTQDREIRTEGGGLIVLKMEEIPNNGECRINPPQLGEYRWPIVQKKDFCGQFKQKEIK
jgi:hypothetical protein